MMTLTKQLTLVLAMTCVCNSELSGMRVDPTTGNSVTWLHTRSAATPGDPRAMSVVVINNAAISAITLLQLQILWDPLVSALLRQSVQLPRTSGFRDCCCFYRLSLLIYCDLRCNSPLDVADAVDDISVCVFVVSKEKKNKKNWKRCR